jgi:hypothetical protein
MFRLFNRSLIFRHASTATPKERWDLCVAVLVERLPIISKSFNEIENEMMVRKKNLPSITLFDNLNFRKPSVKLSLKTVLKVTMKLERKRIKFNRT